MAKRSRTILYLLSGIILIVLGILLPAYELSLLIQILIFALFAMSLNLLMGYTGLPSFGHAAFFGVGAYTAALFSTKVPLETNGNVSFLLAMSIAILMAAVVAAIFGLLVLRTSGVYFLMLTLALAQVLWAITFSWRSVTGGDDGVGGITRPDFVLLGPLGSERNYYYLVLLFFALSIFLLYRFVKSPFGNGLIGIRENENRMQSLGYNTWRYKYVAYILAGVFGGLAGVLNVYYICFASPYNLSIDLSGLVMFMVIIGGSGFFVGPIIGAASIFLLRNVISAFTQYWLWIIGAIFVFTIMYAREGIMGYIMMLTRKIGRREYGVPKS
jgi:branched-chain amino acid transport system permease protein